jgi:hypothetical protein
MLSSATFIRADLAPFVFELGAGFAIVEIVGVAAQAPPADQEHGTIEARVLETIRPQTPRAGTTVTFEYVREAAEEARPGRHFNAWNTLPLEKGARLLVAWKPADTSRTQYAVLAGDTVTDVQGPSVRELREAVAIHALPANSALRPERLAEALVGGTGVLRRYACAAVGPRQAVPRDEGVGLLRAATGSARSTPDDDLALAETLMDPPLLDPEKGDDAPNVVALTTLAEGFINSDPAHAGLWFRFFYSRVMCTLSDDPDDDRRHRRDLLRALDVETGALAARLQQHGARARPDTADAAELLEAWRHARA